MNIKIIVFDSKKYDVEYFDKINESYNYSIKYCPFHLNDDTVKLAENYDVVCVFVNDKITEKIINKLYDYKVKLIALRCAGYNNVDFKAAYNKIHIARVPAYSPYSVAEHTITLITALNRKIHKAYLRTKDANFSLNGLMGFDLFGKTAGVIGTGKIGQIVIQILKGFGVNVLAYDKFPNNKIAEELKFSYVDLNDIYEKSDIITLHCPLNKETEYLINSETISLMKKGVMIINTGRGKLINTKALIDGLKSGKIGYAGLDVYEEESEYFFEDYSNEIISDDILARLLTFNNVLITSHQGFFTKEALTNIASTTFENIHNFFVKNIIPNEVCYNCQKDGCKRKSEGKCF